MIGAIIEAPAPVVEVVSGVVVTEVSVVGNVVGATPGTVVFASEGVADEATTDSSVVGKSEGGVAAGAGEADFSGSGTATKFAFSIAAC